MKRIVAALLAVVLLSSVAPPAGRADPMPLPPIPQRNAPGMKVRKQTAPLYAVAAGLTAVALTASLIALRVIRRKSLAAQTPADADEKTPENAGQATPEGGGENTPSRDQ
jgi:predicted small lipoprotein YifL